MIWSDIALLSQLKTNVAVLIQRLKCLKNLGILNCGLPVSCAIWNASYVLAHSTWFWRRQNWIQCSVRVINSCITSHIAKPVLCQCSYQITPTSQDSCEDVIILGLCLLHSKCTINGSYYCYGHCHHYHLKCCHCFYLDKGTFAYKKPKPLLEGYRSVYYTGSEQRNSKIRGFLFFVFLYLTTYFYFPLFFTSLSFSFSFPSLCWWLFSLFLWGYDSTWPLTA